jgi:enoyl-CoA hydratase
MSAATDPIDIVLKAPGRNAMSTGLMTDLRAQLRAAAGRPLLLTGGDGAFCAGLNLKEVMALDLEGMRRFLDLLEATIEELYCYPGPLVVAVNGHAIAGGCVITLCGDHRVMQDDPALRIGLNEVALGLEFPPRVFAAVQRRVAPRSLERVVLEAALYDPPTALTLGLIDAVATDPVAVAREHLARLAAHPVDSFRATKRTLRGTALPVTIERQRWFHDELVPKWVAPELRARIEARLSKR